MLVLCYLLLQLQQLVNYQDPVIVNYDTYVDRGKSEPISLADYNMYLKFFFMSPSGTPEPLRPEIGKFILQSSSYGYINGQYSANQTTIEIEEIDFI